MYARCQNSVVSLFFRILSSVTDDVDQKNGEKKEKNWDLFYTYEALNSNPKSSSEYKSIRDLWSFSSSPEYKSVTLM